MFKSNKIIIAGSIVLAAGLILMVAGFAFGGFRISKMNSISFTQKEYAPTSEIRSFHLEDKNTPVEIRRSPDNRLRVKYYESKYDTYIISENDGVLSLRKESEDYKIRFWHYMFNFSGRQTLVLYLPEETLESLDIGTTNGSISAEKVNAVEIKLKSTNGKVALDEVRADFIDVRTTNGRVELEEMTVSGEIRLRTTNGSVRGDEITADSIDISTTNSIVDLENLEIDGEITVESSNGRLELSELRSSAVKARTTNGSISAEDLTVTSDIILKTTNGRIEFDEISYIGLFRCETKNGAIRGKLPGQLSDYSVKSHTTNSRNSLPENIQIGEKQLEVETTNNAINVTFGELRDSDD